MRTKDDSAPKRESVSSTIVVVPRDRFTLAVRSLTSIVDHMGGTEELVYVDAGSPRETADQLRRICAVHGFIYVRREHFLSPNQARNLGLSHARTPYVVFVDNDVIVSEGWLRSLEDCANETGAEVVAPLTCQKEPVHSEVHQAGGEVFDDFEAFLSDSSPRPRLKDVHTHQGQPVADVALARKPIQCCEFHCVLVRRDVFDQIGTFDEKLLSTKEHIDFSLSVWKSEGRVMLEPKSVVTFLFPDQRNPLRPADWPFFLLRWSPEWQRQSLSHFRQKWGLEGDTYFDDREGIFDWRYRDGIAKPIIRKLPFFGQKYRVLSLGQMIIVPFLKLAGRRAVRRHAHRTEKAA